MQRRIPRLAAGALAAAGVLALTACGSGFSGSSSSGSASGGLTSGKSALTVLIGSSGDAETAAVKSAVADWSSDSGTKATVQAASDLNQQLSQGFASGKPADVFYLGADTFANYAKQGSLLAYGDQLKNKDDFYDSLVTNFTYDKKLYCAPKDFSTLALEINTKLWDAAGLTDADVPTTWDQLKTVAQKLTKGKVTGLVTSNEYQRLGAFMVEAGGNLMNDDSTKATADTAANTQALTYVQDGLKSGWWKFTKDVGAGWGGEAFGKQQAAMTIEGNWITGAMKSDYPGVDYTVVKLPAGPSGEGTLQFTNCWGIAADSPNQAAAVKLVEQLTSKDDQLAFGKAFGVMPSIESAADGWKQEYPDYSAFIDSASFAKGVPTAAGATDVVTDLNSKLGSLKTADVAEVLGTAQKNLSALQG
ncbi:extracellular solute-binding protein [uncultured Amnibacterium sp.]|uniref:sugar ABC transporter substrate-binding protein n=1 Tax=uncultured Amnibacterium sp. TaxID=1631851 RepID=UPI0035CC488E